MLTKRIIPCLDIKDGKTVKGINFINLQDVGDPVELAEYYAKQGADELVFLDITATNEKRKTLTNLVTLVARKLDIPFTVGGGINSINDVEALLGAGADKISVNTSAFNKPSLIDELAKRFGSQCIVVAIDTKFDGLNWKVHLNGGTLATSVNSLDWAKEVADRGAGEILLTSMNNDGAKNGFAIDITRQISDAVTIPVIASGGAGTMEHFLNVSDEGNADAALAASIFHYKEIGIFELKKYLKESGITVRF